MRKTKTRIYKSTDNHAIKTRWHPLSWQYYGSDILFNGLHSVLFFFLSFQPVIFLNKKSNFDFLILFFRAIVQILISSARTRNFQTTNLFSSTSQPPSHHDEPQTHLPSNKQQPPNERQQSSRNHLHRHTKITTCHCPSKNDNRAIGDSFSWTTVQVASD